MANSELIFEARLNTEASIENLVKEDIPKIEKGVDEAKRPAFVAHLNIDKSQANILKELEQIGKSLKLDFGKLAQGDGAKKASKQIAQTILNPNDLDKQGTLYFRNVLKTIGHLEEEFKQVGNMSEVSSKFVKDFQFSDTQKMFTNVFNKIKADNQKYHDATAKMLLDENKMVKSVVATYTDEEGVLKRVNFERRKMSSRTGSSDAKRYDWVETSSTVISTLPAQIKKTNTELDNTLAKMNQLSNAKLGMNKNGEFLAGTINLKTEASLYNDVKNAIDSARESVKKIAKDSRLSEMEKQAEIRKTRTELEEEIKLRIQANTVSNRNLRGNDVSTAVAKANLELEKMDAHLKSEIINTEGVTSEFNNATNAVAKLQSMLKDKDGNILITNKSEYEAYILEVMKAKNAINSFHDAQKKVKFNSDISNFKNEIAEFKSGLAEIPKESNAKLAELESRLESVSTKGGLSQLKNEFKSIKTEVNSLNSVSKTMDGISNSLSVTRAQLESQKNTLGMVDLEYQDLMADLKALEEESRKVYTQSQLDVYMRKLDDFDAKYKKLNISVKENANGIKLNVDVENATKQMATFLNQNLNLSNELSAKFGDLGERMKQVTSQADFDILKREMDALIADSNEYINVLNKQAESQAKIRAMLSGASLNEKTALNSTSKNEFIALRKELQNIFSDISKADNLTSGYLDDVARRLNIINTELSVIYKESSASESNRIFGKNILLNLEAINAKAFSVSSNFRNDSQAFDAYVTKYSEIESKIKNIMSTTSNLSNEQKARINGLVKELSLFEAEQQKIASARLNFSSEYQKALVALREMDAKLDSMNLDVPERLNSDFVAINNEVDRLSNMLTNITTPEGLIAFDREMVNLNSRFSQLQTNMKRDNGINTFRNDIAMLSSELTTLRSQKTLLPVEFKEQIDGLLTRLSNPNLNKEGFQNIKTEYKLMVDDINRTLQSVGGKPLETAVGNIYEKLKTMRTELQSNKTNADGLNASYESILRTINLIIDDLSKVSSVDEFAQISSRIQNVTEQFNRFKTSVKVSQEMSKVASQGTALAKRIETFIMSNSKMAGSTKQQLQGLSESARKATNSLDLARINNQFTNLQNQMRVTNQLGKGLVASFKSVASKFSMWFGMTQLIMRFISGLRQMIENVKEIDKAMVSLKKVTDETAEGYRKFFDDASEGAKKLSVSITDLINASADFARLGYDTATAEKFGELATVYLNVSEYEDINEASESIISTMKAFKEGSTDLDSATRAVNAFNEVGNNFAISSQGIGEALKRSASAMHVAGNDMSQTIALATAANTIIQDPDVVGTALKSLSLRLTSTKTELEELGESTEFAAETLSEYRNKVLALTADTSKPLDIQIDENSYKNTYQIIGELSEVWGELTQEQQLAIEKLFAGRQQANVFAALVENFDIAKEAYETSVKAIDEGTSAMKEQTKWQEGLEAKTNDVTVAFQELSENVFPKETLVKFLEVEEGLVNIANLIAKTFGGIPLIIGALVASITKLNVELSTTGKKFSIMGVEIYNSQRKAQDIKFSNFDDVRKNINSYNRAINQGITGSQALSKAVSTDLNSSFGKFSATLGENSTSVKDYGTQLAKMSADSGSLKNMVNGYKSLAGSTEDCKIAQKAYLEELEKTNPNAAKYLANTNQATASTKGLRLALIGARVAEVGLKVATVALNAVMSMGLTLAVSALISGFMKLIDNINNCTDALENLKNVSDNYEEQKKGLDEVIERYKELCSSNADASEKQAELIEIKKLLLEQYGFEAEHLREVNGLRKDGIKAMKEEQAIDAQTAIQQARANVEKVSKKIQKKGKGFKGGGGVVSTNQLLNKSQVEDELSLLGADLAEQFSVAFSRNQFTQNANISFNTTNLSDAINLLDEAMSKISQMQYEGTSTEFLDDFAKDLAKKKDKLSGTYGDLLEGFDSAVTTIADSILTIYEANGHSLDEAMSLSEEGLEEWKNNLYEKLQGFDLDDFTFDAVKNYIEALIEASSDIPTVETQIADEIDSINAKIQESTTLLNEVPTHIDNAVESLEKIDKLIETNNDTDKYFGLKEIEEALTLYPELASKVLTTAYGYKIEKQALEDLRDTRAKEKQETINAEIEKARVVLESAQAQLQSYLMIKGAMVDITKASKAQIAINQLADVIDGYQVQVDLLDDRWNDISDTNDDLKNTLQKQKDVLDKQKDDLEKMKDDYEDAQKKINSLLELTMEYIKKQKELEKEALKDKLDAYKKVVDLKKKELDMEKEIHDFQKDVKEKNKTVTDLQTKIEALNVEGVDYSLEDLKLKKQYEEEYAKAKTELDETLYEHEIDTRKDALDKEYDLFEEQIDAQTKAIEDYLDHEGKIRSDAIDLMNGKTQEFYNNLYDYVRNYTTKSDYEFQQLWNDAYDALAKYGNGQIDVSGVLDYLAYQIGYADAQIQALDVSINNLNNQISAIGNTTKVAMDTGNTAIQSSIDMYQRLKDAIQGVQDAMGSMGNMSSSSAMYNDPRYSSGAYSDLYTTKINSQKVLNGTMTLQEFLNAKKQSLGVYHDGGVVQGEGEVFAKLMSGEVVTTEKQAENFLGNTLPKLMNMSGNYISKANNTSLSVGDIVINGNATQETVTQLKALQNSIADNIFKKINSRSKNRGLGVVIQ